MMGRRRRWLRRGASRSAPPGMSAPACPALYGHASSACAPPQRLADTAVSCTSPSLPRCTRCTQCGQPAPTRCGDACCCRPGHRIGAPEPHRRVAAHASGRAALRPGACCSSRCGAGQRSPHRPGRSSPRPSTTRRRGYRPRTQTARPRCAASRDRCPGCGSSSGRKWGVGNEPHVPCQPVALLRREPLVSGAASRCRCAVAGLRPGQAGCTRIHRGACWQGAPQPALTRSATHTSGAPAAGSCPAPGNDGRVAARRFCCAPGAPRARRCGMLQAFSRPAAWHRSGSSPALVRRASSARRNPAGGVCRSRRRRRGRRPAPPADRSPCRP